MKKKYQSPNLEVFSFETEKIMGDNMGGNLNGSTNNGQALDDIFDYCDHVGE